MREQIEEDFRPFEKAGIPIENIEATFTHLRKTVSQPLLVRYRILNNELYRYFPKGEAISLKDNSTERAIKTLMQFIDLPNMDFILSYFDGMTLEDNYHVVPGGMQAPILISAKQIGVPHLILIPDWRSIGEWWIGEIKQVNEMVKNSSWDSKKEFAIWRGSFTKSIRRKFCQISLDYPDYLDARINYEENPQIRSDLEKEGLWGGRISMDQFIDCKYLPFVDGVVCASPAFQWRLLSNCVTFKPVSDEVQWFYRDLKPYVHYIPLKADLSDLIDQLEWAKSHDAECKKISEEATRFANQFLMYDDVLLYFTKVLYHYASLQNINVKEMRSDIRSNPEWVCIQYREKLGKAAKQKGMKGYTTEQTPF
jgi:hypothetical protein